MVGKKSSLKPMWERIQKVLDLDPPTQMDGSTYLGCRQDNIEVDDCIKDSMEKWKPIFEWCTSGGNMSSQAGNAPANEHQEAVGNSEPKTIGKNKETSYAKAMRGRVNRQKAKTSRTVTENTKESVA